MTGRMYENYVFDLYGTLVDIHTDEWHDKQVWEKLALFMGYYGAHYEPLELQDSYMELVASREKTMKSEMDAQPRYAHEAFPEIKIEQVFLDLYEKKGIRTDEVLAVHTGQFFRVLTTEYVKLYEGVEHLLDSIHAAGKKVYLLSNAQRIFTEYEMNLLDIKKYFDGILISSDHGTKKPDSDFFEMLKKEYGIAYDDSIMIGNDGVNDIAGAKAVGMDTFYIHSNLSPESDHDVQATYSLDEMNMEEVARLLGFTDRKA